MTSPNTGLSDHRPAAGFFELLHALAHLVPITQRDDPLDHFLPRHFHRGEAENPFGGRVPGGNAPRAIDQNDGVLRDLSDHAKLFLALGQPFFGALATPGFFGFRKSAPNRSGVAALIRDVGTFQTARRSIFVHRRSARELFSTGAQEIDLRICAETVDLATDETRAARRLHAACATRFLLRLSRVMFENCEKTILSGE